MSTLTAYQPSFHYYIVDQLRDLWNSAPTPPIWLVLEMSFSKNYLHSDIAVIWKFVIQDFL